MIEQLQLAAIAFLTAFIGDTVGYLIGAVIFGG